MHEHATVEGGAVDWNISPGISDFMCLSIKILLDHGNPAELFESREESDGTRRIFLDLFLLREPGHCT